jgi:poly(A) polymerase
MGAILLDRSWLDAPQTRILTEALGSQGIEFRFVGGAVRDALLGRVATDVDIATTALPQAVAMALKAAGLRSIPTGIAHGTITALAGDRHFEITTLRRDVETDGRHAVVAFTDDWREDAARRDFTMNALYADAHGVVTDYFGGIDDAKAGRIRFIGDPELRITEDALRLLRFFRFHAHYGQGALDPSGLAACAKMAGAIDRLSGQRVRDEIFKTLRAPDPCPVWQAMIDAGVMAHVIPSATHVETLARMVALETSLGLPADPLRRLSALIGTPANLKERLKLSNQDADRLSAFGAFGKRVDHVAQGAFGRALYGAPPTWVLDAAMLSNAATGIPDMAALESLIRFTAGWVEPRFPLSGNDLQATGMLPGPEMGRILAELEDWWIAAEFIPDHDACKRRLKEMVQSQ